MHLFNDRNSNFKILNPINVDDWNSQVLKFEDYSFFHSKEWAKVLVESYLFIPTYFAYFENDELIAAVPMMLTKSWLTGNRVVSLPFSDFCEPLFKEQVPSERIIIEIVNHFKNEKLKYLEFRSSKNRYPFETKNFRTDLRHVLKLDKGETELLKTFSENTKRNIKKAKKANLVLKILNDETGVKVFFNMNCETRKKHGLPPQPFSFFNSLLKNVIQEGLGDILLAEKDGNYIAGAVYLKFGKKLLYKFGASYSKYFDLRGNNFVMWEAIKKYLAEGFDEFDFGRTELGHEGLKRFKLGWNTEELSIYTTRYNMDKKEFLPAAIQTQGFHNTIFSRSPIFLLKLIGNTLYKHVG